MSRQIQKGRGTTTVICAALIAMSLVIAPVKAEEPIKIGFGMALTGALAGAGKAALIAMEIWAEDVNAAGGLLGRPVELIYYDDQTNPGKVPAIYTKLINIDKVDLIVSGYGTATIVPAMPIAMNYEMTFMTLFGLAVNEEFRYERYFQILPVGPEPRLDWSRGFFAVAMSRDTKPRTVALVGANAEFPRNALIGAQTNLRPKAPAFIRRVLFLHSALLMGWHARRAWSPQVAQARGAHLRACLLSGPSVA